MTTNTTKPFVLHVDDEPDDLRSWQTEVADQGRVRIEVCHPDDVTKASLSEASLVLVDFKIERWPRRDGLDVLALQPVNGLALLSVLQEAAYELDKDRPRAFALFTAVVRDVARGLVPQAHIVARANNLEWMFDKTTADMTIRASRMAELAEAVKDLPSPWPGESGEQASNALRKWLRLPDSPWRESAWQDVLRCHPPMHEFAEHTHGIGVLRWALHRVWPYPTFLIDDAHVAARLRVDLVSLQTQLDENAQLRQLLLPTRYTGPLSDFVGRRWWRAGIESVVFSLASRDPASMAALHEQLRKLAPAINTHAGKTMFPVLDETFATSNVLAAEDDVVEVVPDDWPPFADSAWALKTDIQANPGLATIAVPDGGET